MTDLSHLHGAAKGHDPPDPHVEGPMDVVQDPPAETSSKLSAAPAERPRTSTAGSTSAPPAESRQRTEAQAFDVPPSPDDANVGALRRSPSVPFSAAATPSTTASAANHQRQDARGDSPIDSDVDLYMAARPVVGDKQPVSRVTAGSGDHQMHESHDAAQSASSAARPPLDLVDAIHGMYRILDLVSESSSGGLVDKVLIAQESLGRFINDIRPGAYMSMTKVNFGALDAVHLKPLGVYGSHTEIVRFLVRLNFVSDEVALLLERSMSITLSPDTPHLRSGLYILRQQSPGLSESVYVIYWPQPGTWRDGADSSIRKNRVTFMRYLTKIAHQTLALISAEHASHIVWSEDDEEELIDEDEDDSDRLFSFEVAKTKEQDEDVQARPGFSCQHPGIFVEPAEEANIDGHLQPTSLMPRVVRGETSTGFLTAKYIPLSEQYHPFDQVFTAARLRNIMSSESFRLSPRMSMAALDILLEHGLDQRAPEQFRDLKSRRNAIAKDERTKKSEHEDQIRQKLKDGEVSTMRAITFGLVDLVSRRFPYLDWTVIPTGYDAVEGDAAHQGSQRQQRAAEDQARLSGICMMYPRLRALLDEAGRDSKLTSVSSEIFTTGKQRLFLIDAILREYGQAMDDDTRRTLIRSVLDTDDLKKVVSAVLGSSGSQSWFPSLLASAFGDDRSRLEEKVRGLRRDARKMDDAEFLARLPSIVDLDPLLTETGANVGRIALDHLQAAVKQKAATLLYRTKSIQEDDMRKKNAQELAHATAQALLEAHEYYLASVDVAFFTADKSRVHVIDDIAIVRSYGAGYSHWSSHSYGPQSYRMTGIMETRLPPSIEYSLSVLQLTEYDKHQLQLDPSHRVSPQVHGASSATFGLPTTSHIQLMQLLPNDFCLLVFDDGQGHSHVFAEPVQLLSNALARGLGTAKKKLQHEKIGGAFLLAYDETKRMLAVCVERKLSLHLFVFDERYTSLRGLGSQVELSPWYDPGTRLTHMTFVGGGIEEIVLVDQHSRVRSFSLVTQLFRPASVVLPEPAQHLMASPDGACFFSVTRVDDHSILRAFHWSNFGSGNGGIVVDLGSLSIAQSCAITSFINRANAHFVTLDTEEHALRSTALAITRKVTEFSFKEKGAAKISSAAAAGSTAYNSLLDCHSDVWTRFPVVPAVRRRTITVSAGLQPRAFIFVTDREHDKYRPYWKDLISRFEQTTKKPTEKELSSIRVEAVGFDDAVVAPFDEVSELLAGEWLVDILCLIPIHIAVTRDNRFLPLADGVISPALERDLLGAKVEQIVDKLSFGWYESIFQSYMSTKPVKVVSSMGEQSVGKSFALNHLVDTSFAGSAMRTTEGVWMSVNPTDDALIVALDFEGVHSIERSAQEDTLLVLFNTAISNLVLFRNNFALSRDITGLFQSFQSSSTVLDPATNPDLFRSTLVIIIKDVVDSDTREIAKEFSLKFQQIVQQEQEANFISRLHRGRMNIIPWPVIESRHFYSMFPKLKKCLDKETVTHPQAGMFLQTLKTLMAKLKANDWGSMSQNLAAHRAQLLLAILPTAVMHGVAELEPVKESLKNFDTNAPLAFNDTDASFLLAELIAGDQHVDPAPVLSALQRRWISFPERADEPEDRWIAGLSDHLNELAEVRAKAVQAWVAVNTERFADATASIDPLRREMNKMIGDLKSSVQLCKMKCVTCNLSCLQGRHHDGGHSCLTDHRCKQVCQYRDRHVDEVACGMPAGHPGAHICDVSEHLCGRPCHLLGKEGCMGSCTKVANHDIELEDFEHVCQATVHECGEPCSLIDVPLESGGHFTCTERCQLPSHEPHEVHSCGTSSCPITCQLCKRLCADRRHLHALIGGAIHLCGQEHACPALCAAEGICHIETTPQSVEATFTGRHEQFQYTKYSQIHRRLPCAATIAADALQHQGSHTHKLPDAFHHCKTTCENCGYYCTLPFGHPQQEHETSHGSMSKTRWAVDGPDGEVLELNGRKFSSNDDGAPMLCSMVCRSMGRHAHVAFCRSNDPTTCSAPDVQHSQTRMLPSPERPKDWISHKLHWQRTGFKDPYSQDDRNEFEKCDSMCAGPEHQPDAQGHPQPSYCTLPLFHPPHRADQVPPGGGYVSGDGHLFSCRNPAVLQNAFHVMFVIDRSGSMGSNDRQPLAGTPTTQRIAAACNNRLGAVYSALYAFWSARSALHNAPGGQAPMRRDAYSVILFDDAVNTAIANDFQNGPDALLNVVLAYRAGGGTNYERAMSTVQTVMEQHWSTDRSPIVIFLSDGECSISDAKVQDVCRRAITLGGNLSFHAVAFGPSSAILQRMVNLATDIQHRALQDPMRPAIPSSYTTALDSIRLAETFLGIADSLRKPRGSLLRN